MWMCAVSKLVTTVFAVAAMVVVDVVEPVAVAATVVVAVVGPVAVVARVAAGRGTAVLSRGLGFAGTTCCHPPCAMLHQVPAVVDEMCRLSAPCRAVVHARWRCRLSFSLGMLTVQSGSAVAVGTPGVAVADGKMVVVGTMAAVDGKMECLVVADMMVQGLEVHYNPASVPHKKPETLE